MDQSSLARQTLRSLEDRLNRLRLIIHGVDNLQIDDTVAVNAPSAGIATRLESIGKALDSLENHSGAVRELIELNKRYVKNKAMNGHDHSFDEGDEEVATSLVLSHAPLYTSTAAQLRSMQDLRVPDAASSVDMLGHTPRLVAALGKSHAQDQAISELRERTVIILDRWRRVGIAGLGEVQSEWEGRMTAAESSIRQMEGNAKREADGE